MDLYIQVALIALGCIVVIAICINAVIAASINKIIFGGRQDKNPNFKYFTPQDFGLKCEDLPVFYNGVDLYGKLYYTDNVEDCKKLVIFVHGFGAGSSSYMTEIAHFAGKGKLVLAVDAFGCNNSAGSSIRGFYAGAEAVIAAYIGVNSDKRLKDMKKILVGHSWGAYSVLAASKSVNVDGVVAMSAFDSPAKMVTTALKTTGTFGKLYAPFVYPFIALIFACRFGVNGNIKASKAIVKSGAKALLIHGEKDALVPLKRSAANLAKGENITSLILPDKGHNPYNTVTAEAKLKELTSSHNFANEEEEKAYYASFDWTAATEEDEKVMAIIDDFIAKV